MNPLNARDESATTSDRAAHASSWSVLAAATIVATIISVGILVAIVTWTEILHPSINGPWLAYLYLGSTGTSILGGFVLAFTQRKWIWLLLPAITLLDVVVMVEFGHAIGIGMMH